MNRKDIYIEGYNGAIIRDVLIFSTSSQVPPDETADTHWNVTARVYYDCATEGKPAILKFRRSGSQEVIRNVKLRKGKGHEIDIHLLESVSQFYCIEHDIIMRPLSTLIQFRS